MNQTSSGKPISRRKARRLVVQALYSIDLGGMQHVQARGFPWYEGDEDLAFAQLLLDGTLESIDAIDAAIREHVEHWDLERIARVDLAILRLGVYSLLFRSDIPTHVAIDEAIELAKSLSSDASYRFINGVLDAVRKAAQLE